MLRKDQQKDSANIKEITVRNKKDKKRRKVKYFADRIIVRLKKPEESESLNIEELCQKICEVIPRGQVLRYPRTEASRRVLFKVSQKADLEKLTKELSKREEVEYAELDYVDQDALILPNDSRYNEQWALEMVNAERAWDVTTGTSDRILIGIIDSGISITNNALDHEDLNSSRYILGTDFVDGGTPRDLRGHGTHVTGIAAAESNNCRGVTGMNWLAPTYICRTLNANGNGSSADFADAVEEIVDYALLNNLKVVINYSAGGGDNVTKMNACQYADDNGMILCAAAGNDFGGDVIFPAAYSLDFDAVIAVGSTDSDDTVSNFSNIGPEITVVAPGNSILSTTPTYSVTAAGDLEYEFYSGTSMACPLVTGLIALMWSRRSFLSNSSIRQCLIDTAVKLGPGTFNNSWGNGRVDAYQAVSCIEIYTFCFLTPFTFFTAFTSITELTHFTEFTPFTQFTRLTPFTRFTPFTPLTPFTVFSDVTPFIRFKNKLFELADIQIDKFDEFKEVQGLFEANKLNYLHEIASEDLSELANIVGSQEKASYYVGLSQSILKSL
ncbi:MAG: S8 family serine peptidase [Bacteroidia bacterium]|nr:S8 family serine peptidase [Bacteroidia bacterium]